MIQSAKARYQQARQLYLAKRYDAALQAFKQLKLILPSVVEVDYYLGLSLFERYEFAAAERHLKAAEKAKPNELDIQRGLLKLYERSGQTDRALALYDGLIKAHSKTPEFRANKGLLLQQLGDFDRAEKLFRTAIKKFPTATDLYRIYIAGAKLRAGDPLVKQMKTLLAHPKCNDAGRIALGYALAKVMEDTQQYDQVFKYLNIANHAQRKSTPYSIDVRTKEIALLQDLMRSADFENAGSSNFRPIFISGMPRSGTTLIERHIANATGARAMGELTHSLRMAYDVMKLKTKPVRLDDISHDQINDFASTYADLVKRAAQNDVGLITDKSIQSHLIFGLLHRAFPKGHLIAVHRDPAAVALSIYKNHFATGTHGYSTDLGDIARMIKTYDQMIAFWEEQMPDQVIHIRYEDFVSNTNVELDRLIDQMQLGKSDSPTDAPDIVKTLSIHQARQPVSTASVEKWRIYEKDMQPFFDVWDNLP